MQETALRRRKFLSRFEACRA